MLTERTSPGAPRRCWHRRRIRPSTATEATPGMPPVSTTRVNSAVSADTLDDLDLQLYYVTNKSKLIERSSSRIENTENIYFNSLRAGHKYVLKVLQAGHQLTTTGYSLAWRFVPD